MQCLNSIVPFDCCQATGWICCIEQVALEILCDSDCVDTLSLYYVPTSGDVAKLVRMLLSWLEHRTVTLLMQV